MKEEIENEMVKKVIEVVKRKDKISKSELSEIIKNEVKNRNYLKESWQIDYAVKRIKEKIEKDLNLFPSRARHLTGKNIIINSLIAFIPLVVVVGILRGILMETRIILGGILGALIYGSIILGFIYLAGEIREKIKKVIKKHKTK